MQVESNDAELMLRDLCDKLKVRTTQWTWAATDKLRAVAAPRRRPDGRWDVVVHVQRAVPNIPKAIFRCMVQVKDRPDIRASVTADGRLDLGPIDGEEASLELYDVSGKLAESLQQATAHWRDAVAASARARGTGGAVSLPGGLHAAAKGTLDAAADDRDAPRVWQWTSRDGLLSASATRSPDGLKFYFQSAEPALDGRRINIVTGEMAKASLVLGGRAPHEVAGATEPSLPLRSPDEELIRFALPNE